MQPSNYREWPRSESSSNRPKVLFDTVSVRPGTNLHSIDGEDAPLPFEDIFLALSKFFPCKLRKWPGYVQDRQLNIDFVIDNDITKARSRFGGMAWFDNDAAWIVIYFGTYLKLKSFVLDLFGHEIIHKEFKLDAFPKDYVEVLPDWIARYGCDWIILHEFGHISRGHGLKEGLTFFSDSSITSDSSDLLSKMQAAANINPQNQDHIDREVAADFYAAKSFGECITSRVFLTRDLDNENQRSLLGQLPEHYTWIPAVTGACAALAWLCYYEENNINLYPSLEYRLAILVIGMGGAALDTMGYSEKQKGELVMLPIRLAGILGMAFESMPDTKAQEVTKTFRRIEQEDDWLHCVSVASGMIGAAREKGLIDAKFRRPASPWSGIDTFF